MNVTSFKNILFLLLFILSITACSGKKPRKAVTVGAHHKITGVISYKNEFNDLNETQLLAAKVNGIESVDSRSQAERLGRSRLVPLSDSVNYRIDDLTHSIPYLVPKAAKLLSRIGESFRDSLRMKGLSPRRIVVTSVLRTTQDVKKLRRTNRNASENSCHCYGTTFDIAYRRYASVKQGGAYERIERDTLKLVLSEVLRDLKDMKVCYVKYEVKQSCFHITVR